MHELSLSEVAFGALRYPTPLQLMLVPSSHELAPLQLAASLLRLVASVPRLAREGSSVAGPVCLLKLHSLPVAKTVLRG